MVCVYEAFHECLVLLSLLEEYGVRYPVLNPFVVVPYLKETVRCARGRAHLQGSLRSVWSAFLRRRTPNNLCFLLPLVCLH